MLNKFNFFIILLFSLTVSCSGGGGGSSSDKRSTQTGVRVFHAGLDAIPVGLFLDEEFMGETSYLSESIFTPATPGMKTLKLTRSSRFEEPVSEFPVELENNTEYSVFITGEVKRGTFNVELLSEELFQPKAGFSRIQFLHALIDSPELRFIIEGLDPVSVSYGNTSGFIEIESGEHNLRIIDVSGRTVSDETITTDDQGELSVLVAGKTDYDFNKVRLYRDFD